MKHNNMKKIFILLAASVICFACGSKSTETPAKLVAERVIIGDLYYNLYDNGTAEVTYELFCNTDNYGHLRGEVIIPSSVQVESTTYVVTGIGDYAFYECKSLSSVTIPNSVTSIGDRAFEGCKSLTSVTLPNSVTSIGEYAFYGCTSLTSVTIPDSVTSIGYGAFKRSGITRPVYNIHVFAYLPKSYSGHYSIPEGIEQIAGGAFEDCGSLTSVTLPNSVTSIGEYAFEDCGSLTSVTISNSVTSIGSSAFYGCTSLTSITIPNSVTSIGYVAFAGSGITRPVYNIHVFAYMPESYSGHYSIPQGIEQIAGGAFCGCESLTSVTIPNSVTSIGKEAFRNCESLTSVTIPNSVTSIEGGAFYGCTSLTSITIPNSVTSIGYVAFLGSGITKPVYNAHVFAYMPRSYSGHYSIPEGIEQIAGAAFANCESLTSITIPHSVTSIGNAAFANCESLTSITLPHSVTSIGDGAFWGCSNLQIKYAE